MILEIGHIAANQVYHYELNSQKSANSVMRAAKFSFSNNHRTFNEHFRTLKNNRQEENSKLKFEKKYLDPQSGQYYF